MTETVRAFDWSTTPLGPIDDWPQSLKTTVDLMLSSRLPMFTAWGEDMTFLYNDAYAELLGHKHPGAIGRPFHEIWSEIWDDIEPMIDAALNGRATYFENLPLTLNRRGQDEEAWFTFSYSPVRDDQGGVVGMFCATVETTATVISNRRSEVERVRQAVLLALNDAVRDLTDPADIAHASSRILAEALNVGRVGYGVMDTVAETVTIERDWNAPGVDSIAGVIHFRDFGSYIEDLARGDAVIFADAGEDPRISDGGAALDTIKARSLINLPLIERGQVVALLFVNNASPRPWLDSEIALVREVAERVRTATERARATVALRENEARLQFLDTLNLEVAKLTDADAILEVTTRMTARHLSVANCAYADMDADQDGFTIRGDWAEPGLASIVGHYQLADFGRLAVQELGAGRPLVINDNLSEVAPDEAASFQALGISATICMPLVKAGRLTALMAIHHRLPHVWSDEELATIREVTERSWAHIERVRSQAELRDRADELEAVFEAVPAAVWIARDTAATRIDGNAFARRMLRLPDGVNLSKTPLNPEDAPLGFRVLDRHGQEIVPADLPVQRAARGEEVAEFEEEVMFDDGTSHFLFGNARPLLDAQGAPRGSVASFIDITTRRQAERAVRESEARFRNMADNTPMMMWVTDPTGFCTYLNKTWYEFTGQTEGEAEGYGWLDATHPDDKAMAETAFLSSNAAQAPFRIEYRLRRADGTYRWALDAASPRFDATGKYMGYVGSVIDIDERREIEDALRASEAQLEMLLAGSRAERDRLWTLSTDMLARANYEGGLIAVSPAWTQTLGWSEQELLTNPYADIINPENIGDTVAALETMGETGLPTRFENRILTKSGEWKPIGWTVSPEPGGEFFIAVGRDLTEDKAKAEALAASTAERDRLWDLSPDLLTVVNYEGRLERINPSWTRVLGWDEQTLLTRPYVEILHPDEVESIGELLVTMRETERPVLLEDRLLTADGSWRSFVWSLSPEPGGERLYGVGRDVTEERAQSEQLAQAQEALRQSQKMEAVGQLTGGIAHDFNNLLAGISGALELLSKRLSEGRLSGMERYIDAAQGSAQRAAALTQRLLAFSRRQTLDPRPTDVNRLIGGMEDLIRRTVGPAVSVEVVGAGGLWASRIDPSQLENALLNLCINARDAMAPDGGRLTIETANKWLDARASKERDLLPGQYVSLCVTDTGAGMTPEVQSQAFDPFFTTKPLGQGTGLGLSMIHGFVRQSGGQVRIYSEVGKGTTMCLYLPRHMGEVDGLDDANEAPVAEGGHGETVMVVDDEETVRMLVAEVLGEAGYNVIEAPDGPSALEMLRSDVRVDLLITDVGLPGGMNGRQVADAARLTRSELKVLFITGYAENAAVGNGLLDVGMAVMTKPFVMADLGLKVHEMIEG